MARVGSSNYHYSSHSPVTCNTYWRECINRDQWNHAYHAMNEKFPQCSYKNLNTTNNDVFGRTWHLLQHTHSTAAGKSSYHNNALKPRGPVAQMSHMLFEKQQMKRDSSHPALGHSKPGDPRQMRRSASGGVPDLGLETLRGEVPAPPGRTAPPLHGHLRDAGNKIGGWAESHGSGRHNASMTGQPDARSFQRVMNA
eukprot:gnl/MRDRNA2_/MRDRNA2_88069_c0_seq1.p1 gnl/MRDRNA2_/MRDRNA2_88069_c0~~gnl/MRDRNA2_/MRDRNA2_88069_c0_seq1.p1  ORF type:complete len:197 (+),score=26.22 gnl/MRDRNA2_/MRDRNA2_88069_c0_seq1:93-683(+)